ncbi:hypothetical protein K9F62_11320 [Desulfovibrio sp. JY]|nr:hypothetical protein K9F62_11320 [Desulfovibrio sp. JY]
MNRPIRPLRTKRLKRGPCKFAAVDRLQFFFTKIVKFLLICLVIELIIAFPIKKSVEYANKKSRNKLLHVAQSRDAIIDKNSTLTEINIYDPVNSPITDEIRNNYFQFGSTRIKSSVVEFIKGKMKTIEDLTKDTSYSSLYTLMLNLRFLQRTNDEYNAFRFWIDNQESTKSFNNNELEYMLIYIHQTYQDPALDCFLNKQSYRAHILINHASTILKISNPPPLNNSITEINDILLTDLLFSNPAYMTFFYNDIFIFLKLALSDFPPNHYDDLQKTNRTGLLKNFYHYWEGVYLLRDDNYDDAYKNFSEAAKTQNPKLKNASILMKGRVLFWKYFKKYKEYEKSSGLNEKQATLAKQNIDTERDNTISILTNLSQELTEKSYRSDLSYYVSKVKDNKL